MTGAEREEEATEAASPGGKRKEQCLFATTCSPRRLCRPTESAKEAEAEGQDREGGRGALVHRPPPLSPRTLPSDCPLALGASRWGPAGKGGKRRAWGGGRRWRESQLAAVHGRVTSTQNFITQKALFGADGGGNAAPSTCGRTAVSTLRLACWRGGRWRSRTQRGELGAFNTTWTTEEEEGGAGGHPPQWSGREITGTFLTVSKVCLPMSDLKVGFPEAQFAF